MPSPFYGTTPRRLLRYLLGTSNISDVDAGFLALATDVENTTAGYSSGTHAARGSATAYDGLLWRETDTGVWALYTGSAWIPFGPLAVVSSAINVTATAGQAVFASAGVTVTLPAATTGAVVQISASNTVTGASPVLVSSGSANIFGGGVSTSGVSSFALGTGSASVTLAAAAGNWQIVAGQQDSGWVTFTYAGGAALYAGTPASRLRGDRIDLRDSATIGPGGTATITTAHRPASAKNYVIGGGDGNGSGTLTIPTSGVIGPPGALGTGITAPAHPTFDGIWYPAP